MSPPTNATGNPPQCPSTCYDGLAHIDTRCYHPAGHTGKHSDGGGLDWCEPGDCRCSDDEKVRAISARMTAILGDKATGDDVADLNRLLDMAERATCADRSNQCPAVASDGTRCELDAGHRPYAHTNGKLIFFASNAMTEEQIRATATPMEEAGPECKHTTIVKDRHTVEGDVIGRCAECGDNTFPIREASWYNNDTEEIDTDPLAARIVATLGDSMEALTLILTPAHMKAMAEAGFRGGHDNPVTWLVSRAERAQDFEDDFARVKAEDHAGDEIHCACVVHLRRQIEELKAEVAALTTAAQNPFVMRIDGDGGRFWERECSHERTYRTEATVCRRCDRVVGPGLVTFSGGTSGGSGMAQSLTSGGAPPSGLRVLASAEPAPTAPHPFLMTLPPGCQSHGIYSEERSERTPDLCAKCGYWTRL